MASDEPPAECVWEGDSRLVIRSFPEDAQENLGADLRRVQNGERPLDSGSMAPALPGVFELRDEDKDFWYRLLYVRIEASIYLLHCFKKKTNGTPQKDINTANARLKNVKQRLAEQKMEKKHADRKQK